MTPRQKALLIGAPSLLVLLGSLGWFIVDRVLDQIGVKPQT